MLVFLSKMYAFLIYPLDREDSTVWHTAQGVTGTGTEQLKTAYMAAVHLLSYSCYSFISLFFWDVF